MPPPPQLFYSNDNSPVNSFFDYMFPIVDRLVRLKILSSCSSSCFVFLVDSHRQLREKKHLIIMIVIPIDHRAFRIH